MKESSGCRAQWQSFVSTADTVKGREVEAVHHIFLVPKPEAGGASREPVVIGSEKAAVAVGHSEATREKEGRHSCCFSELGHS